MRKRQDFYQTIIGDLGDAAQMALRLQFQHDMMLEKFIARTEREQLKKEIAADVLASISVEIEDEASAVIDQLLNKLKFR